MERAMSIRKPKINVRGIAKLITQLARHEHTSISSLGNELIIKASDPWEDMFLSALAESRELDAIKRINHEDAWK